MNSNGRLSSAFRLVRPSTAGSIVLAVLLFLSLPAYAQPNPAAKIPPSPAQGVVSPSGKFTPAYHVPATSAASPQTPAEAEAALRKTLNVQWLGSNTFRLGRVEFDKEQRTVTLPARICILTQVVEYALVTQQGKVYESLLTTEVTPTDVHLAFLLLGVGPVQVGGEFKKEAPVPETNALRIQVAWETNGQPAMFSLPDLISLTDVRQEQPARLLASEKWLYNGSLFDEFGFVAQREGSIVSLIRDPAALVNNPGVDRDNDQIHFPNARLLPPPGSPVRVVLSLPPPPVRPAPPLPPWAPPITPLSTNYLKQ